MIAILLLGSMNSTIFGSSRYLFAGAKRGIMPGALRCAHPTSMSPRMAVIVEVLIYFHNTVKRDVFRFV